ncbi:ligand-binding sensor domain-containing protein [Intestinibacter bartlettii]|uniref:ligand-binding sensor domain-containing protein n=1 Tax=Intestinibacter bartlettii TaxID=261299 RepID=UPI00241F3889|nr:sensor histidine kinase [Intestinibacter bartlettii]
MKNRYIKKVLVVACILSCINIGTSYANMVENYNFKNITIEDGLSQSTVETIYQDSKGYIWIGTNDGLDRYNGYEFKYYKHDKDNKNSIPNNYIVDIIEDKNGHIWVSTINGLSRIDTNTDEVKNYSSDKNNGNLSDNNLWQILYTTEGKFLVSSINGLNLYDEENDTFNRVLSKENELPSQFIYSVKEDSNGHIWVGTDKGLVELDKSLNLVKSYEDTVGESEVYNIYDDLKGNVWVCTLDNGLFRINLSDKSVKNYKNTSSESSIMSNNVRDVVNDSNGQLWVATDKGICAFDYKTEKFRKYNKKAYESNNLVDNMVFCLFKDRCGVIWVGTYKGVSIFNPDTKFLHFKSNPNDNDSISGDMVQGIYKDDDDLVWMGTSEQGINIMDGKSTQYINTENSNLISDTIQDITGYKDNIFIGTNNGLSVLVKNGDDYTITNYTEEDGLPSNKIRSLFCDSKGNLWIGTNKGLAILDSNNKLMDITYILDEMGVADKFIRAVFEDSKGNYYIGCFLEGGLIKINPKTKEYKVYKSVEDDKNSISSNCIRYINEDLNGNILVGTSYGLNILDTNKDKFKSYTEKDGLINNIVYGVLVDDDNNIWMSTNGGISKLSADKNVFENFTITDGLQSNEFNGRSCFKANTGYMYFGGVNGFNVFNPNDIDGFEVKPQIMIDDFEVNGVNKKDISNTGLKYSENNIKISFFTNDYRNTSAIQYYYKLNGEEWDTTKNNSILFVNLNPGNYELKVKAKNQQGVMSEEHVVKFTIKPPFWKSKLAICTYLLLIALAIIKNRYEVKKLDRLVNERTNDLIIEMEKNESLFKKVLSLEQNKNNYFVNLSHELRTPLNVLCSISQLIKNISKKEMFISHERLSYYMEIMDRNTSRLLKLINNIIDNTKIENNSYVLTKEDIDIVYLVEETVIDMKDYIEEKGLRFIFDTDVEEKLINCDKAEIERCIINLVSNAVKFTPKGGLIEVILSDLDDKVKISVKDNGIGISEENKRLIFDRFNQVIDKNAESKGGSGLGLTICKQLITLHGGEIYVESEVGVGSEFVIILPVSCD